MHDTIGIFSTTYSQNITIKNRPQVAGQYYDCMQGTSMACPLVAGLCGLMLSKNPSLTSDQIKAILQATSVPLQGNHTIAQGAGMIDAYAAMQAVAATVPQASFTASLTTADTGASIAYTNTSLPASQPDSIPIQTYKWYFQGGTPSVSTNENPVITYHTPGMFSVTLVVTDTMNGKDSLVKENFINIAVPAANPATLNIDRDTLYVDYFQDAEAGFNVISNINGWAASTASDWLTLMPTVGDTNGTVFVKADENRAVEPRTAIVKIQYNTLVDSILIVQKGGLSTITFNRNAIQIDSLGGIDSSIVVIANTSWTAAASDSWLSVLPLQGMADSTVLAIYVDSNLTNSTRTGTIAITAQGIRKIISVKQTSFNVTFSIYPAFLTIGGTEGSQGSVIITTSIPWVITPVDSLDWLSVNPMQGNTTTTVAITASNNPGPLSRTKQINITAGGVTKKVTIKQDVGTAISVIGEDKDDLQLYPNPFTSFVYVMSDKDLKSIEIIDITGKIVLHKTIANSSQSPVYLDLGNYAKGIYVLKILTSQEETIYKKLVKM